MHRHILADSIATEKHQSPDWGNPPEPLPRLARHYKPESVGRRVRKDKTLQVFMVDLPTDTVAFFRIADALSAAGAYNATRDPSAPAAIPRLAEAAVYFPSELKIPGLRPHKYELPGTLTEEFEKRCAYVGIEPSRVLAALMLNCLLSMTPEKTPVGMVRNLEGWESSKRKFREWTGPTEPQNSQAPAETVATGRAVAQRANEKARMQDLANFDLHANPERLQEAVDAHPFCTMCGGPVSTGATDGRTPAQNLAGLILGTDNDESDLVAESAMLWEKAIGDAPADLENPDFMFGFIEGAIGVWDMVKTKL